MKKVELVFYKTTPSEKNIGLKHVLWQIQDAEGNLTYDWGFAEWLGTSWNSIEVPEGYTADVSWWANTTDPEFLIKEPSKIIKIR